MSLYSKRYQSGFTLVEVMIVVAIIGVLSALAYPNYTEHVRKGRRAEARAGLLQAAQWMERAATATGVYPKDISSHLKEVNSGMYNIAAVNSGGATFTLTATPTGVQETDKCGTLTLEHTGERKVSKGDVAECWNK